MLCARLQEFQCCDEAQRSFITTHDLRSFFKGVRSVRLFLKKRVSRCVGRDSAVSQYCNMLAIVRS
jgi:hypothetical protein